MNGREQVSTGDNRSIEFDQYPSELINQVVVYKTPDSQIVGQGLGLGHFGVVRDHHDRDSVVAIQAGEQLEDVPAALVQLFQGTLQGVEPVGLPIAGFQHYGRVHA